MHTRNDNLGLLLLGTQPSYGATDGFPRVALFFERNEMSREAEVIELLERLDSCGEMLILKPLRQDGEDAVILLTCAPHSNPHLFLEKVRDQALALLKQQPEDHSKCFYCGAGRVVRPTGEWQFYCECDDPEKRPKQQPAEMLANKDNQ